eukprot:scaffold47120_cov77-Cyclotella_meneghiniana.AAC.5
MAVVPSAVVMVGCWVLGVGVASNSANQKSSVSTYNMVDGWDWYHNPLLIGDGDSEDPQELNSSLG